MLTADSLENGLAMLQQHDIGVDILLKVKYSFFGFLSKWLKQHNYLIYF